MKPSDWALLKGVSRSFYLTLRLLPGPVRESIALAYLLARLSDTEADGAESEAERELLRRRGELEDLLSRSPDREAISAVWATIQDGQRFDTERFGPPGEGEPRPPLAPEERDHYTYLVAGCVGEFWTGLCARRLRRFSRRPLEEMTPLGVRFGQGLQLVNILRDRASDQKLGRVYLPEDEVADALKLARSHLTAAESYCRAVLPWRLRAACALPLLMGRATLDLVEKSPAAARVKISRRQVWLLLGRSLVFPGQR